MNALFRQSGLLALFALATTGIISLVFYGTEEKIQQQVLAKRLAILNDVIPSSLHDNLLYQDCRIIEDPVLGGEQRLYLSYKEGELNGFAIETTARNGYSGNIDLIIGVSTDMTVQGVRVLQHKETPGLGDKIELAVSDWILSFNGRTYTAENAPLWRVKKDGGQFDQFTGATITPRAVVNQVANTLLWLQENRASISHSTTDCQGGI